MLRRYMLHPLRSRHNPLTRAARTCTLLVVATGALIAASELRELRIVSAADKAMLAELLLVVEGKSVMRERVGRYEVVYSVNTTTYEVSK